jgi:hypothetical protein
MYSPDEGSAVSGPGDWGGFEPKAAQHSLLGMEFAASGVSAERDSQEVVIAAINHLQAAAPAEV